jgi:S-adenosylmethionine synthetase
VAYAIGVAKPVGFYVNTYGTARVAMNDGQIAGLISKNVGMTPYEIETRFNLRTPMYKETASFGHMGRTPKTVTKTFKMPNGQKPKVMKVNLFPWEETAETSNSYKKWFGIK